MSYLRNLTVYSQTCLAFRFFMQFFIDIFNPLFMNTLTRLHLLAFTSLLTGMALNGLTLLLLLLLLRG